MTGGNSSSSENIETGEDTNKKQVDTVPKCIEKFVKNNLRGNKKKRVTFINEIMNSDSGFPSSIDANLDVFLANNSEFSSIDKSKITLDKLKKYVGRDYLVLENNRQNFRSIAINEYDITPKQFDDKIGKEIKTFDDIKLKTLVDSEKERGEYLKLKFGKSLEKKELITPLERLISSEGQKRFKKLDKATQIEVGGILLNYEKTKKINDIDLRILFESAIFSDDEKKELVHTFIPTISLEKAVEVGLINTNHADRIKNSVLEKALKKDGISSKDRDSILEEIDFKDINISTKDFFSSKKDLALLGEKIGFKNLENDLKSIIEEVDKGLEPEGPQNFEEFKEEVKNIQNFSGMDNLQNKGDYFKVTKLEKDGESKVFYIKVLEKDIGGKNKFRIQTVGENNEIYGTSRNDSKDLYYGEFIKNFSSQDFKVEGILENVIEEKLINPNDELKKVEVSYVAKNKDELNKKVNNLNDELILKRKELEEKADDIYKEIGSLEKDLKKDKNNPVLKEKIERLKENLKKYKDVENNPEYQEIYNHIKRLERDIECTGQANFDELIKDLDYIDPDGKGLSLGSEDDKVIIETEKGGIYEISSINREKGLINIISLAGPETIDYHSFFESFKKNKSKRLKKLSTFDSFIQKISANNESKSWDAHKEDSGKLYYNEAGKDKKDVKYLVSKDNDKLLKINKIYGNKIDVQLGERKESKDKNKPGEILYIKGNDNKYTFSLDEFRKYIEDKKLFPDYKIGTNRKIKEENVEGSANEIKGSLGTRLFDNWSISELILGGKLLIEGVEDYLKKGNDIHSAKAALAMGKFLPDEVKRSLEIKVETREAEQSDKEVEELGKVDSPIATERIKKWLKNKDTPEYKKEAGLMFMLQKYGMLYAKTLYEDKDGSYLWYTAFGGKIGDELFNKIKEEAEGGDQPMTFSEELLMFKLIGQQSRGQGPTGIKRRSRLHKEFEGKWNGGGQEDYDKGYKEASSVRSSKDIVEGAIFGELLKGTVPNAIGRLKMAIERGGSLETMSRGFFDMLYSGQLYGIDQKTFILIKSMWDGGKLPIIMTRFCAGLNEMKLFNKTVLELSKSIGEKEAGKYPKIAERAQTLYDRAISQSGSEADRIREADDFWGDYGTVLSRSLNMADSSDLEYSKTDKIIEFERKNNSTFDSYYDSVKAYSEEGSFGPEVMDDSFGADETPGVSGLNTQAIGEKFFKINSVGVFEADRNGTPAKKVWKKISDDINSTPNKLFTGDDINSLENREMQKDYLKNKLRALITSFLVNTGGNISALKSYNNATSSIGGVVNKWGLNLYEDFQVSADEIKDGMKDSKIEEIAENIICGKTKIIENSSEDILDQVKKGTNDIINLDD